MMKSRKINLIILSMVWGTGFDHCCHIWGPRNLRQGCVLGWGWEWENLETFFPWVNSNHQNLLKTEIKKHIPGCGFNSSIGISENQQVWNFTGGQCLGEKLLWKSFSKAQSRSYPHCLVIAKQEESESNTDLPKTQMMSELVSEVPHGA